MLRFDELNGSMKALFLIAAVFAYLFGAGVAPAQAADEIGPVRTDDGIVQIIVFFPEKIDNKMVSSQDRANKWLEEHPHFIIVKMEVGLSVNEKLRSGIEAFQSFISITYRRPIDESVAEQDSKDPPAKSS